MKLIPAVCSLVLAWPALAGEWFPVRMESPKYPPLASQARIAGVVRLRVTLSGTGKVLQASVLSGNAVLARAAQANVLLWLFASPCSTQPHSFIEFTYDFKLDGVTLERPASTFRYDHPYKVTVTSQAQHWTPNRTPTQQGER